MDNSDMPAMPSSTPRHPDDIAQAAAMGCYLPNEVNHSGLSKREHFAAMAMQGIISNPTCKTEHQDWKGAIAADALEVADALLEELSK